MAKMNKSQVDYWFEQAHQALARLAAFVSTESAMQAHLLATNFPATQMNTLRDALASFEQDLADLAMSIDNDRAFNARKWYVFDEADCLDNFETAEAAAKYAENAAESLGLEGMHILHLTKAQFDAYLQGKPLKAVLKM